LPFGEWAYLLAMCSDQPEQGVVPAEWDKEHGADTRLDSGPGRRPRHTA